VRETRQRVHLVHELRQLRGSEELFDCRHDRTNVDERLGCDRLGILRRHALAHDALHARQTDAHLVLDELAHRTDAAVREVVLVVEAVARLLLDEVQHVRDGRENFAARQHRLVVGGKVELVVGKVEDRLDLLQFGAELAVQLVTADARQVVTT